MEEDAPQDDESKTSNLIDDLVFSDLHHCFCTNLIRYDESRRKISQTLSKVTFHGSDA